MANDAMASESSESRWQPKQVYVLSAVCLLVGLAVGYFFRGSAPPTAQGIEAARPASITSSLEGQMPTLDQMKQTADSKAEPLLAKLKDDPTNAPLLVQIGDIYKQNHQFKEAADYYDRSLKIDSRSAGVRSDLASCLYYNGSVDAALEQLKIALQNDPKNAASLFNLGMIRWRGKKDAAGAIAAWEELLKTNPQLGGDRKAAVQKLIADVKQHGSSAN
jgi:Cytochrome c biogenesis factor